MKTYEMSAKVWLYPGYAAWHFITLPKKESAEIKSTFEAFKRGWGSLPINVTIGKTTWKTSIFPDKKADAYLLPLKAEIRKKEQIQEGDNIKFTIEILINY